MPTATCHHCGTSFRVARAEDLSRATYCCAGCALRAKVPVDEQGNFPVNGHLGFALAIGFVFFNQFLCWGMHGLLLRQGKLPTADAFSRAGVVSALLLWLGVAVFQWRVRALRGKDVIVAAIALGLIGVAVRNWPPSGAMMASASAILLIWNFRGIFSAKSKD